MCLRRKRRTSARKCDLHPNEVSDRDSLLLIADAEENRAAEVCDEVDEVVVGAEGKGQRWSSAVSVVAAVVIRAGDGESLQVRRRFGCFAAVPPMFCIDEREIQTLTYLCLSGRQQSQL